MGHIYLQHRYNIVFVLSTYFTDQQFDKVIKAGMSDTQLYKQAGNAVTVNVISAVGQIIKDVEGDK